LLYDGFILVRKKLLEVMPTKQQHAPAALKRPLERRSLLTLGGVALEGVSNNLAEVRAIQRNKF
jgi:hypothetical protein